MRKRTIIAGTVILLAAVSLGYAQDPELHGSIDVTYLSKYVWRGFDIYGDKSAVQPSVNLDLFGTGFGVGVMGHRANSGKYENGERWDYSIYYGNSLFDGESYATNYTLSYLHYNFPDCTSHKRAGTSSISQDVEELHAFLSWPNLLPVEGLVPRYVLVKLWPSNSGSTKVNARGTASGWAHIFMLDYGVPMPGLFPSQPEQVLRFHSEAVFNDGVHPAGGNADHDWTNVVFGVATDFDLGGNFTLTPGVYHQITMDKSVNPDQDETWATVGVTYKF